jgi:hypothetical protein
VRLEGAQRRGTTMMRGAGLDQQSRDLSDLWLGRKRQKGQITGSVGSVGSVRSTEGTDGTGQGLIGPGVQRVEV